ncbi:hypothetical protein DFP72DRAFT_1066834 [Ephemerocybe angulata]|uniref:Transmembrane protein n=1 Tax=Ephemerocybe angulata TaxID=980116 RepID=A0A8H6I222_9AGAR|nr:hypothetical protein DFP72DRAFT_1066834 [Tulosesus angulatus]
MYNVPDLEVVLPAAVGEKETYVLLAVWLAAILYDMLMIYRCWIVWNKDWRVIFLPILLYLITLAKGIVTLLWVFRKELPLTGLSLAITIFLNMCVPVIITHNAICTALIVFKILRQHQMSRAAGLRSFGSLVGGGRISRRTGLVHVARIALENGIIFVSHLIILTILHHARSSAALIFQITLLPSFSMGFIMMYVRVNSARAESEGAHLDAQRCQPSWVNATSIRFLEPQSLDCPEPPANES